MKMRVVRPSVSIIQMVQKGMVFGMKEKIGMIMVLMDAKMNGNLGMVVVIILEEYQISMKIIITLIL